MKSEGHPDYHFIKIALNDGTTYWTRSTYGTEVQTLTLDIDPTTHAAWTGATNQMLDRGWRIGKFKKRFEGLTN